MISKPYSTLERTDFPNVLGFDLNFQLLNANEDIGYKNYAKCKFSVYVSTDASADAAFFSTLAAVVLNHEKQMENLNAYQKLFK